MDYLVVEDDPMLRELIACTLRTAGHSVSVAVDGLAALDTLNTQSPDAILLDVNMPRMDGFTFLQRIRQAPATQDLPVLMLTARSEPSDIRQAINLGASDFVGKPFEPNQLLRRLERMMKRHAATKNAA